MGAEKAAADECRRLARVVLVSLNTGLLAGPSEVVKALKKQLADVLAEPKEPS